MTMPTNEKTWQWSDSIRGVNSYNRRITATGTNSTTLRNAMWELKSFLIGFALNPWVVKGSGNGAGSAAMDNTDRWVAPANVIGNTAGNAHSWIVLRQTGIASNFELCIDMTSTVMSSATIVISPSAGFSGGSNTARPTATDEIVLVNSTAWSDSGSTDNDCLVNAQMSSDGQCTRLFMVRQNLCLMFVVLEKPADTSNLWINPSYGQWLGGSSESTVCAATALCSSNTPLGRGRGSATMNLFLMCEASFSNLIPNLFTSANDLDADSTAALTGGANLTFAAAGGTITRSGGDWVADGFAVGKAVAVSGSVSNNGPKGIITVLTTTVMTVSGTVVNEGPSAGIAVTGGNASIPFCPIGFGSTTTAHRGRHGRIRDMWFALATPGVTGDAFPASNTNRDYWLIGDVILPAPANGTAMVTA